MPRSRHLLAGGLAVDALVVESVYPTIEEAISNRISSRLGPLSAILTPALLAQLQPRFGIERTELRPIDRIGSIRCPVLIVAGAEDRHTPASETRRLFAAAREPKQLWLVEGAGHEDLLRFAPEAWETTVLVFFDEHLERRPSRSPTGLNR